MKWTVGFVMGILLLSCWMLLYEQRKTSDNLPESTACLHMEDRALNRRVSGYLENQLLEVWGNPSYADAHSLVWKLEDGALSVKRDSQGKAVSCRALRIEDLPVLNDIAAMTEEEISICLTGRFTDQLSPIWGEADGEKDGDLIWNLPLHSPHREVSLLINDWGMVLSAKFKD